MCGSVISSKPQQAQKGPGRAKTSEVFAFPPVYHSRFGF